MEYKEIIKDEESLIKYLNECVNLVILPIIKIEMM